MSDCPWDTEALAKMESLEPANKKKRRGSFIENRIVVDEIVVTDEVMDGLENCDPSELLKETYLAIQSGRKVNLGVLNFILQKAEEHPTVYLQIHNYLSTDAKYSENLIKLVQQMVKLKSLSVSPADGAKTVTVSGLQDMLSSLEPISTVLGSKAYGPAQEEKDDDDETDGD